MRMAPKAILIGIIFSIIPALMLLIDPKDWTLYEKVLCCLVTFLFVVVFTLAVSFYMGVFLPRRVHKKYDGIIQAAFDGFTVKRMKAETVADFIFLGSKITADGDCSHEIKRRLLLGRKVMTNCWEPA